MVTHPLLAVISLPEVYGHINNPIDHLNDVEGAGRGLLHPPLSLSLGHEACVSSGTLASDYALSHPNVIIFI